ncbi:ABC transporter substrate-binding protein [Candidatus Desantisbacteria bacterium]|nr:ABC transporter substrate-binding protein [Candidatus Desantisbacteria bacterium]
MKIVKKLFVYFCLFNGLIIQIFAVDQGVTDTEILIGSSLVLEGPANYLGIQTSHGVNSYINSINESGGVNGKKIKIIIYNDNYEPIPCVKNTQKLINEDKVFVLTSYVGTPTSVKALPVWTNAKVPLVGFFTGAEQLRTPFNRYNIHIRASYYDEAAAIIDVFVNQLNFKKIAVFYQYDAFGETVKKGTEIAMAKFGLTPVAYGNYERNTLNIEEGLNKIKLSKPEGIVMVGTYSPLAKFVKEAKKSGLTKTVFHTVSFVGPEMFAKELGKENGNCIVTQVMPPYIEKNLPIIKEYLQALKKYYPKDIPNFVSLEGFVNGKILVEGLKRAGKNLTREGFIDAIETIKAGQIGTGLGFNYGPRKHTGLDKVYITHIENDNFVEVKDWTSFVK